MSSELLVLQVVLCKEVLKSYGCLMKKALLFADQLAGEIQTACCRVVFHIPGVSLHPLVLYL